VVWLARHTGRDGKRRYAKPTWNRGKGTFERKADAQRAIDEAYGLSDRPDTLGDYFSTWTERHPAGVNDADLAEIAGHRVETMLARYTHSIGASFPGVRELLG
jgi:hypothetical protein